jgi:small nuclear ribonucleoprotein D3
MKNGEIYRGLLLSSEDTMNMSLSEVLRTARNGQITKLPSVYLRGSSVRFIALPEMLKNAPVFQKVTAMKRKMEQAQQERQKAGGTSGHLAVSRASGKAVILCGASCAS